MKCPNCGEKMVSSNIAFLTSGEDRDFYTEFFCFGCVSLYGCTSDSEDFVEEYLYFIGEI